MPDLNFVERLGLKFLQRRIERKDSNVHRWTRFELAEIQRLERRTVTVAALAGATSGVVLGGAEIWLSGATLDETGTAHWRQQLPYWSIYMSLAVLVSGAEILYLYYFVLRTVARISSIAGLSLTAREIEQLIARGLSRAAMELPNPREPIYGIDPYARVPRWKLVAYAILYRIKIGATSFVLRVLLRRILARAALRFFIPLVAIPVFATWNALIARWVMREVRIRVAGPLVVQELGERISAARQSLTAGSRRFILQSVGEAIIRGEDAHPNYALLLARLIEDLQVPADSIRVDWAASRAGLKNLDGNAQDLLLTVLTVAAILNSRLRRAQRDLLVEAHALCGRPFHLQAVLGLRRAFIDGQGLGEKHLTALGALRKP